MMEQYMIKIIENESPEMLSRKAHRESAEEWM